MVNFKNVELSDRNWVNAILYAHNPPSLEYNFTTLFIWNEIYKTKIAQYQNTLLAQFGEEKKLYLFPIGKNPKAAIEYLLQNFENLRIGGIGEKEKDFLEIHFPKKFNFFEDRNMSDYIYTSQSLMTLTGKKLSSKRNHINRFLENNPDWSYEEITKKNISEVDKMHDEWVSSMEEKDGLFEEGKAVKKALKNYFELGLSGGAIRCGGKIIAFSMGDKLNDNTFIVHIEKAFHEIQGAYPMINKQFVIANCRNFEFVNREEDTGDEGLRRAKLSYNPHTVLKKYYAVGV